MLNVYYIVVTCLRFLGKIERELKGCSFQISKSGQKAAADSYKDRFGFFQVHHNIVSAGWIYIDRVGERWHPVYALLEVIPSKCRYTVKHCG